MAKIKRTVFQCDNPECNVEVIQYPGEPVLGFHLYGSWDADGFGGPIPRTYAHAEECVVPALKARFQEAWDE